MKKLSRRDMLRRTAWAGVGVWAAGAAGARAAPKSPNEKLDIAVIGCGGRGAADLKGVASENIVALCDVDENRAAQSFKNYPRAKKYRDFRTMLDQLHNQIDAVVVATPDHTHAPAAMLAMKLGKHCYCEHQEWIAGCKTGSPTTCNFAYSGALTEAALLGSVSYRTGQPLQWDAQQLKATNCPQADPYLRRRYRGGWTP